MNQFFSELKSRFTTIPGGRGAPMRDWFALLTFFLLALIASALWNAWLFARVEEGGALGGASTSTTPVFNRSSLEALEKLFADRQAEAAKYETGVYRFVDPSK